MKTVLVPVDLSPATARVCDAASDLAKLVGARLLLVHVVQPPPAMMNDYYAFDTGQLSDIIASNAKSSARQLHSWGQKCEKCGQPVKTVQVTGNPVSAILEKATATCADYIVIGTHGHTAVYDLLVGGTTHGVLRKARCPVLVIPMIPANRSRGRR